MMTIFKETPQIKGVHDVHNRMCNRYLYEAHGIDKDGCHEIISQAVAPYGLLPEDIPDTMDLFMNYKHDCTQGPVGGRRAGEPPGDYIEFRAEMDCLVGLSNCPEDTLTLCNGGKCTPVKIEVYGKA